MGDSIQHTLIFFHRFFGVELQDNSTSDEPLYIITENHEFDLKLKINDTVIFTDINTHSTRKLHA